MDAASVGPRSAVGGLIALAVAISLAPGLRAGSRCGWKAWLPSRAASLRAILPRA